MIPHHPLPKARSVLLYPREDGGAWTAVAEAAAWLIARNVKVALPDDGTHHNQQKVPKECIWIRSSEELRTFDLLIALGGDGTLLRGSRWAARVGLPVLGINLGDLGFLTAFRGDQLHEGLQAAVDGRLFWEPRLRMSVKVQREGKTILSEKACNDAYIKHGDIPRLLQIATEVGGQYMATYRADGLIVCTPMGSTAYNLAAGGPIVDPGTEVFTISPICPHSLTHRPVVVAATSLIRMSYRGPSDISTAFLTIDGQRSVELALGDQVEISDAAEPLKLCSPESSVFEVLATKLGWSGPG